MTWVDHVSNRESIVSGMRDAFIRSMQERYTDKIQTATAAMFEGSKTYHEHQKIMADLCETMSAGGIKNPKLELRRIYQKRPEPAIPLTIEDLAVQNLIIKSYLAPLPAQTKEALKNFFAFQSNLNTLTYYCIRHGADIGANPLTIIAGENEVMNYLATVFGQNENIVQSRMQEFTTIFEQMDLAREKAIFYTIKAVSWQATHQGYIAKLIEDLKLPASQNKDGRKEVDDLLRLVIHDALEGKGPQKKTLFARLGGFDLFSGQPESTDTQQARTALEAKIGKKLCQTFERKLRDAVYTPDITQGSPPYRSGRM